MDFLNELRLMMTEPTPLQVILAALTIFSTIVSGYMGAWVYRIKKDADTRQAESERRAKDAEDAARRAEIRLKAAIDNMRAEDDRQKRQLDMMKDLIQNQQEREEQQALERDRQYEMNKRQQANTEHLTAVIDKFADNTGAMAASIEHQTTALATAIAGEVRKGAEDMVSKVEEIKGEITAMGTTIIAALPKKPAELADIQTKLDHLKTGLEGLAEACREDKKVEEKPALAIVPPPADATPSSVPAGLAQTDISPAPTNYISDSSIAS